MEMERPRGIGTLACCNTMQCRCNREHIQHIHPCTPYFTKSFRNSNQSDVVSLGISEPALNYFKTTHVKQAMQMHQLKELRICLTRIDHGNFSGNQNQVHQNGKNRPRARAMQTVECHLCGRFIEKGKRLINHMDTHGPQSLTFPCGTGPGTCSRYFRHPEIAAEHRKTRHVYGISGNFKCAYCSKVCSTSHDLFKHLRTHTKERPLQCEFCHRWFSCLQSLKSHSAVHSNSKPYACDICGKPSYRSAAGLRNHKMTHRAMSQKPQTCPHCSKAYVDVKGHIRLIHSTEESAVSCPLCPKMVKHYSYLRDHLRTHTREKSYKCQYCEKSFRVQDMRKKHERVHTKEKPYECKSCGAKFSQQNSLIFHERKHLPERPFQCQFCTKSYLVKRQLGIHAAVHHPENAVANISVKLYKCEFCDYTSRYSAHAVTAHVERVHVRKGRKISPYVKRITPRSQKELGDVETNL